MPLSEEDRTEAIRRQVLELLRLNKIACCTPEELITPELEAEIRGEG